MTEIHGKLVFDSWNDAVPDLRGSAPNERHLIYEGGGVLLDLLLKPASEGACLQIGGQVMPTDDLAQNVSHVPVLLENGRACERTHTNVLGEFSFQYAPSNGCFDISIVFGSRKFLVRGLDSNEPRKWQVMTAGNGQKLAGGGNTMKQRLLFLAILLLLCCSAFAQRRTELIVTVKDGQSIDQVNKDNKTTTLKHIANTNVYLLAQEGDDDQALRKLKKDSNLQTVELNSGIDLADSEETVFLLDDSAETIFLLDKKTILNGVEVPEAYARQQALSIVEADKIRAISTGAATRVVTIDTGVDFNHPALRPWLDAGADLVNGRSASEYDGLALADSEETIFLLDTGGQRTAIPTAFGHGTLVAGMIHVIAPDAVIVPIKAFDPFGRTSMYTVIQAVYRAIELKADVINMSFSTGENSMALRTAVNKARSFGVSVVSSMGNGGRYTESVYPAGFTGVYGVAATDFADHLAPFSNYGKAASISAPGTNVISTAPGGHYAVVSGTSFSAPLVSGTVSLLASLRNRGNAQGSIVITTAEPIDAKNPGFERMLGKGRVNARLALQQLEQR